MPEWMVWTPPYERYSGSTYHPPEYGSDVVMVEAETKKEALVEGLRELRRTRSHWVQDRDGNPFNGLKAERQEQNHDNE